MMMIGTLALTGFPLSSRRLLLQGRHHRGGLCVGAQSRFAALRLHADWSIAARAAPAFYSWRLIFMTFHGEPRATRTTSCDHVARDARSVMLVAARTCWPSARCSPASLVPRRSSSAHGVRGVLEGGAVHAAGQPHPARRCTTCRSGSSWPAVRDDGCSASCVAYQFYIRRPEHAGGARRAAPLLYRFLLNKWYFDELYDFIFVRPAKWLGRFLWKQGDGWLIDGFGPDGVSARVVDVTRSVVRLQTGYLYHYAFAMLIGVAGLVTWMMFGGALLMIDWPILSVVTFLPLVGAAAHPAHPRRRRGRALRNIRWIALWTTVVTFVVSLVIWCALRHRRSRLPVRREGQLARRPASPTTWASTASRCCSSS